MITDVCFCEYTNHGHCGVLNDLEVDNEATLVNIAKQTFYNIIRHVFLYREEKLNPFTIKNIYAVIVLIAALIIGSNVHIPSLHFIVEIVIKGLLVSGILFVPLYYLKISEDLNEMFDNIIRKLLSRISK